jgi:LmbE family N-acetylglucosaminyl deacetylase
MIALKRGIQNLPSDTTHILAIGAHPDDVVLGIGGLLAKFSRAGFHVAVLSLSSGELSGVAELREAEEREAARRLGVAAEFARLPDGNIPVHGAIAAIDQMIRRFNPVVALSHSKYDTHQDHIATWEAAAVACRRVPTFLTYEGPSSVGFEPNVTLDVTKTWDKKLNALAAYTSQISEKPLLNWVDAVARYRAWPRNVGGYCEGLRTCHSGSLSIPRLSASSESYAGEEPILFR